MFVILPKVPSQNSSTPLYPSKVLWAKEHAPIPCSFNVFNLDSHLNPLRSLRARHLMSCIYNVTKWKFNFQQCCQISISCSFLQLDLMQIILCQTLVIGKVLLFKFKQLHVFYHQVSTILWHQLILNINIDDKVNMKECPLFIIMTWHMLLPLLYKQQIKVEDLTIQWK